MSCTIQNYGFTKNGQWVDSNCRALTTDNIACKANIYFDSAVGDIYLWFNVKSPDNSVASWRYNYTISSSGTVSIDVGMGTLTVGNYYINSVVVTDKANTYQMCSASGTPNNCRSLNIISGDGGGGANPPIVNYKGMSYHNWGGCSEFSNCNLTENDVSNKYVCIMVNVTTYESGTYRVTATYNFKGTTGSTYADFTIGVDTRWLGIRLDQLYTVGTYQVTNAIIQKIG